jgi:8-oxo-dGTP diphosphatase
MILRVFVATFIFRGDAVLLLERSRTARFAPGRWTGVGGRVEPDELNEVEAAALREVREETGLSGQDLRDLRVRLVLTLPEAGGISVLVFCAAETDRAGVGPCDEGTLHWVPVGDLHGVDMIDNARRALNLLIEERRSGGAPGAVRYGVCRCDAEGRVLDWATI